LGDAVRNTSAAIIASNTPRRIVGRVASLRVFRLIHINLEVPKPDSCTAAIVPAFIDMNGGVARRVEAFSVSRGVAESTVSRP